MIKIITPKKIESQNTFNNKRGYGSQFAYKKYKSEWMKEIKLDLHPQEFKKEKEKRQIIIISVRSKLLDYGNLVGGSKPILDILQDLNVIYNDSPLWLYDSYFQEVDRDNQRTEIIIF